MAAVLLYTNLPTICGIGPQAWGRFVEVVLFAPTIWVTQPLDKALVANRLGGLVTLVSLAEILALSALYGWILYQLLRRRLRARLTRIWSRRARLAVLVGLAAVVSIAARLEVHRRDFRRDIESTSKASAVEKSPAKASGAVTIVSTREISWPGEAALLARGSGGALIFERRRAYQQSPSFAVRDSLVIARILEDGTPGPPIVHSIEGELGGGAEPRGPLGGIQDGIVVVEGGHGGQIVLVAADQSAAPVPVDLYLNSPLAFGSNESAWLVGLGGGWPGEGTAKRLETHRNRSGARESLGVFSREHGGKPVLRGLVPEFGDHATNNLDAVMTSDGSIEILGSEVVLGSDNASRIHLLRFRTGTGEWEGFETLAVRGTFTSSVRTRIALTAEGPVALWNWDGGARRFPEDGLWSRARGEPAAWHLSRDSGAFAAAADGSGGLVVAATVGDTGQLRWYSRARGVWTWWGETALPGEIYTHSITGSDSFVVERGTDPGSFRAVVRRPGGFLVQEVRLRPPA
jgi:hypothetical protein